MKPTVATGGSRPNRNADRPVVAIVNHELLHRLGKLIGPKAPFKPKDNWTMRLQLQQHHRTRELALLNLGIDSKLR